MKKRVILCFVILLFIAGCTKGNVSVSESVSEIKEDTSKIEAKVDDLVIDLNYTGSFNGIKYKYPSEAMTSNVGTYSIIDYMNNGEFIFRIAMYRFENKSLDQTMSSSSIESKVIKNINNRSWSVYNDVQEDGKKMINYAYEYNGSTYTITFIYDKDINNFIDVFMNNVEFD